MIDHLFEALFCLFSPAYRAAEKRNTDLKATHEQAKKKFDTEILRLHSSTTSLNMSMTRSHQLLLEDKSNKEGLPHG